MKLEFAVKDINEYSNGRLYFKNTGEPFDVSSNIVSDLLNAQHLVNGEFVNVFRPVGDPPDNKTETQEIMSGYPDGFPFADVLAKAGYRHQDVLALDRDQLVALKGIGEKSADAILDFSKE
jgi:hypothetical protein